MADEYALVLRAGEHLSNRAVSCPTGEYTLVHQHDGNVVIYRNDDAVATWATGTKVQGGVTNPYARRVDAEREYGRPGRLLLRDDGNLVVLSAAGDQLWESRTAGRNAVTLKLHDSGRLALKDEADYVVWQTPPAPRRWSGWNRVCDGRRLRRGQTLRGQTLTSDNGAYTFVTTYEGAAYLCRTDGPVLWANFTTEGDGLSLDDDGRLGSATANGHRHPGSWVGVPSDVGAAAALLVGDDGRLTLVDDDESVLWAGPPPTPAPRRRKPAPKPPRTRRAPIDLAGHDALDALVVRTDYSDDEAWARLLERLEQPWGADGEFEAGCSGVSDPVWAGAGPADVLAGLIGSRPGAVFLADARAMGAEPALLAVATDGADEVRLVPEAVAEMAVNLGVGNMSFSDFAESASHDPDLTHRGWS